MDICFAWVGGSVALLCRRFLTRWRRLASFRLLRVTPFPFLCLAGALLPAGGAAAPASPLMDGLAFSGVIVPCSLLLTVVVAADAVSLLAASAVSMSGIGAGARHCPSFLSHFLQCRPLVHLCLRKN